MNDPSFRADQPIAWTFHRNTSRWPFNVLEPEASSEHQLPPKEYPERPFRSLPAAVLPAESIETALRRRASCRQFADEELSEDALASVLFAANGVLTPLRVGALELLLRTVPSAGALYPLEVYVLARAVRDVEPGVYHYAAISHGLEEVRRILLPGTFLGYLFMGQPYVGSAAAVLVITAVVHRSLRKYEDRGFRYLLFEAGHVAQNISLVAAASGLGALSLGGFFDEELARLLDVASDAEVPLYAVAVGLPSETDPVALRQAQELDR